MPYPETPSVRGPEALARLPAAERPEWQQLWDDVAARLKSLDDSPPSDRPAAKP